MYTLALTLLFAVSVMSAEELKLNGRALRKLDPYLRYYLIQRGGAHYNLSLPAYKKLVLDCEIKINETAEACSTCAENSNCQQEGGGGGNLIEALRGKLDQSMSKLFGRLGDQSTKLFKSVTGTLGNFGTKNLEGIKNTIENLGRNAGSDIKNVINQIGKLDETFSKFFSNVGDKFKQGIPKALNVLKNFGSTFKNIFSSLKDKIKSLPIIGKRRRRAANSCILNACPVCNKVNLPENPTDQQLKTAMANICGDIYTNQTAAMAEQIAKIIAFSGYLTENANLTADPSQRLITQLLFEEDEKADYQQYIRNVTINFQGQSKHFDYPPKKSMDSEDRSKLASIIGETVYPDLLYSTKVE